jgi:hypothetical protein
VTARFRTRTLGVPFPPVFGEYQLLVDHRAGAEADWQRSNIRWPVSIRLAEPKPATTH